MVRQIGARHRASIEAVRSALTDYAGIQDRGSFDTFYQDHKLALAESYQAFMPTANTECTKDLDCLLSAARVNVLGIYLAARGFLGQYIADDNAVLLTVQNSHDLGRRFGSLTENRANELAAEAYLWKDELFVPVENEQGQLTGICFSETAEEEWFRGYTGEHIGCAILNEQVNCPYTGQRLSFYDLYWEAFVSDADRFLKRSAA